MGEEFDVYLGKRLRRRRRILGLTQQQLAEAIGIGFQQVQKYECGANRLTAARLYGLATALNVPVSYFFEGWTSAAAPERLVSEHSPLAPDVFAQRETLELVRAYYQLSERRRRRLLDLAKALQDEVVPAA